jgi:hypothetical protein
VRKYLVLTFIVILVLAVSGCAPFTPAPPTKATLTGQVVVPQGAVRQVGGQALPGATVNVIDPVTGDIIATTTTDANGNYQVEVPPGGPYIIEAVKDSIKVLDVSPQVEVGQSYDLGAADATSTAVALVFQAKVEAGEDPAQINLDEIAEDPKIGNLIEAIEEALVAGEDPTTAPEVIHLVDIIVSPPAPAPTPTPKPTPKPTAPPTITLTPATGRSTVVQGGELQESQITLSSNYNATGLKTVISLKEGDAAVNFNTVFDEFNLKTGEDGPYNMVVDYHMFQYGPPGGYSVTAGVPQVTTVTGKVKLEAPVGTYTIIVEIKDADDTILARGTYTLDLVEAQPQPAPTGLEGTPATILIEEEDFNKAIPIFGGTDGKITGVDGTMEYKSKFSEEWIAVPEDATEIAGLAAGIYEVRYAAKEGYLAGEVAEVIVEAKLAVRIVGGCAEGSKLAVAVEVTVTRYDDRIEDYNQGYIFDNSGSMNELPIDYTFYFIITPEHPEDTATVIFGYSYVG